jgi:hypothetical protein
MKRRAGRFATLKHWQRLVGRYPTASSVRAMTVFEPRMQRVKILAVAKGPGTSEPDGQCGRRKIATSSGQFAMHAEEPLFSIH